MADIDVDPDILKLASIYPGARIETTNQTYIVCSFRHHQSMTIITTCNKHISMSTVVGLLDEPHPTLIQIYSKIPSNIWSYFFNDFKHSDLIEFEREMLLQMKVYEYYFSEDPKQFLITKIESLFSTSIPHETYCYDRNVKDEHVCCNGLHVHFLLQTVYEEAESYQITVNDCLGMAQGQQSGMIYVHITPTGSMMVGENRKGVALDMGQGTSTYPLYRILFWRSLLRKRPELLPLFEARYLQPLNADLMHRRLIRSPCSTLQEMVEQYDTSICAECGLGPSAKKYSLRSFHQGYTYDCCSHSEDYYPLLLLAVLKNGWTKNRTFLDYRGKKLRGKYDWDLTFDSNDFTILCRLGFFAFLKEEGYSLDDSIDSSEED